jgi:hypothetical protein
MSKLATYLGASTMMRKTLHWNHSRISNVGGGSSAPELYMIGPDGFEYFGTLKMEVTRFPGKLVQAFNTTLLNIP